MVSDELKNLTLREVVENGLLAPQCEGSITLMYNAAAKSCFGEAVACFRNAIHGLKGCLKLCMAAMVLLTMIVFVVFAVLGSVLSNCNKGKKFDHSN